MKAKVKKILKNKLKYINIVRIVYNLIKAKVLIRQFISLERINQFKLVKTFIAKVDIIDEEMINQTITKIESKIYKAQQNWKSYKEAVI